MTFFQISVYNNAVNPRSIIIKPSEPHSNNKESISLKNPISGISQDIPENVEQ